MMSIQRTVAVLAVSTGLMFPAVISTNAAPINATAQKSLGLVSEAASNQVELIGRRGGGRQFRRGGGGRNWGYRGGGRRWGYGGGRRWAYGGGRRWGYGGGRRWAYGGGRRWGRHGRWRHRDRFFWGAPFLFGGWGGYSDWGYGYGGYGGYGNSCYSECRAFNGPRYCRRFWRRYC